MKDYAAIATQYAQDVVGLRVPACRWVRLACERHLDDLDRAADGGWRYSWNPELVDRSGKAFRPAKRICAFAELMPHIKGAWAARGDRIRLEPWQVFILASIFGWIDSATLRRRFWKADLFIPRKNAKSTLAAVVGLYMLALDDEFGAEVYSGATTRHQAMEVFGPARLMVQAAAQFARRYGVAVSALNMAIGETNSKFEPLIGDPGDGASPSCSITDEYHEHRTSSQYDTMITGMGARSQPLALVITTAGSNIGGPCYLHQLELQRVLERTVADDRRFGLIFGIDPEDDWKSPAALRKANPNFGVSISEDYLLDQQRDALSDPRKQAVFRTKHLNIWVNSASPWINLQRFQELADPSLRREHLAGASCVAGLDLASKSDIATRADLFRRLHHGQWHYYLFTANYLPEEVVRRDEMAHYRGWVEQGYITTTPGNMIDLHQIREDLEAAHPVCGYEEIAIDAWGSREVAPQLQANGHTVVDIPMTTRNLSEPMKLIAALIDAGRFHHDGNLATVWMFSNVEVHPDRNDNIFPRKPAPDRKIDAAVAAIVAMARLMVGANPAETPQVIQL